ncbi:hypothetical protein O7626_37565 [Micromonospora sp. WMMD1102]|uniref:hypothetical protein n=1 Tax=Micromonospora sp. WMMD1102 TaxID=3016105 RepID=UPI0024152583|nr:hypothetical protein [Micromonospora sp. WMMD1102]MDG4791541.1 hypothetical protein [Micromonospora sp. WMMD1102]
MPVTRPPHIPPPEIPDLPVDTRIRFESGEWSHHRRGADVEGYVDIRIVRVDKGITRSDGGHLWVWIRGHDPLCCHWESVPPHKPCMELMARVDVLARHAG